jgi:hypothetical protein
MRTLSENGSFWSNGSVQFEQIYAELDALGSIGTGLKPFFREELESLKAMYEAIDREERSNTKLRAEINRLKINASLKRD